MNSELLFKVAEVLISKIVNSKTDSDLFITYKDLSERAKVGLGPFEIKNPIGELSKLCYEIDLPLISSIVVSESDYFPGAGFFNLYSDLKGVKVSENQKVEIWLNENKKIKACDEWDKLLQYINPNHTPKIKIKNIELKHVEIIKQKEFEEGRRILKEHYIIERNDAVKKEAKKAFILKHGKLYCEVCEFDFYEVYGERGRNFIECHHTKMVSEMKEGETTSIEDIAMVCSNCHSMLHRKDLLTIDELKEIIKLK